MSRDFGIDPTSPNHSTRIAATTALTPMVWGTTYIVATELLPTGRPLLAATVRALPVGVAFVLWSRRLPVGAWWWRAAILGLLNIGAFFALLFVAAFRLPGGVAATAGALQPLVAAGIAAVLLGEVFTRRTAAAGATGVMGVALLVLQPGAGLDPIGIMAAIAGTISMATGVVLTKHWGRPVDLITFTGWQLTAGGLMLLPLMVATEGLPPSLTATNVAGFAWLAVVGTGAAYANWFRGIQSLPIAITSFLGLISPLIATIVGWIVLGQNLRPLQLAGAVLVITAVILPQLRRRRPKPIVLARVGSDPPVPVAADQPETEPIQVGSDRSLQGQPADSSGPFPVGTNSGPERLVNFVGDVDPFGAHRAGSDGELLGCADSARQASAPGLDAGSRGLLTGVRHHGPPTSERSTRSSEREVGGGVRRPMGVVPDRPHPGVPPCHRAAG